MVAHSGLRFVVIWLGTGRSADSRVRKVHVRRHGRRVCLASRFWVSEVVGRAWRGHAAVGRRGPSQAGHVRASADAVWPVVIVGRRLKGLWGSIGMRGHGWPTMGCTTETRE